MNIPPSKIIDYDETNFTDDASSVKIVVKRGVKHYCRVLDTSKSPASCHLLLQMGLTYVFYQVKPIYPGWT